MLKGREALEALPELPLEALELSGRLGHATEGPYLTIVPHVPPAPAAAPARLVTGPAPHLVPKRSFDTSTYRAQVFYPYVHCQLPGHLIDGVIFEPNLEPEPHVGNGRDAPRAPERPAPRLRQFKLSAFAGRPLEQLLFCTVKYGPWYADVTETESCIDGAPSRWELVVVGVPLKVGMTWDGTWLDQPTLPNLQVIKGNLAMVGTTTSCCPGNKWCATSHSCIPQDVNCQPPVPF